jgi:hypothetical protein
MRLRRCGASLGRDAEGQRQGVSKKSWATPGIMQAVAPQESSPPSFSARWSTGPAVRPARDGATTASSRILSRVWPPGTRCPCWGSALSTGMGTTRKSSPPVADRQRKQAAGTWARRRAAGSKDLGLPCG